MSTPVTYNVSDEAKAILVERLNLVGKEDLDKKADLDNPEQSICAKKT